MLTLLYSNACIEIPTHGLRPWHIVWNLVHFLDFECADNIGYKRFIVINKHSNASHTTLLHSGIASARETQDSSMPLANKATGTS